MKRLRACAKPNLIEARVEATNANAEETDDEAEASTEEIDGDAEARPC